MGEAVMTTIPGARMPAVRPGAPGRKDPQVSRLGARVATAVADVSIRGAGALDAIGHRWHACAPVFRQSRGPAP